MPASTVRIGSVNLPIAGGGYFRLLPYSWTRWGIRRVNEVEGKPIVFLPASVGIGSGPARMNVGATTARPALWRFAKDDPAPPTIAPGLSF